MDSSLKSVLGAAQRWNRGLSHLANAYGTITTDIDRLREETPLHRRLEMEPFLARNMQLIATETVEFLRRYWAADLQMSSDSSERLPTFRPKLLREVLSVTNPARPVSPYIFATPEIQQRAKELRIAAKAANDSTNPREFSDAVAQERRRFDRDARIAESRNVVPHEALGVINSLVQLLDTINHSHHANATTKDLAVRLASFHQKVSSRFLAKLEEHVTEHGEGKVAAAQKMALDYQHPVLLRHRLRTSNPVEEPTLASERALIAATEKEWNTYHRTTKQLVWFAALCETSDVELRQAKQDIEHACGELALVAPHPMVGSLLKTSMASVQNQLDCAIEQRPFLDRYKEPIGKTLTGAAMAVALAYSYGLAGALTGALVPSFEGGKASVAPMIQRWIDEARSPSAIHDQSLSKTREMLKGIGETAHEAVMESAQELGRDLGFERIREYLSRGFLHNVGEKLMAAVRRRPNDRYVHSVQQTLAQQFEETTEKLTSFRWLYLREHFKGVMPDLAPDLLASIRFGRDCADLQKQIRMAGRMVLEAKAHDSGLPMADLATREQAAFAIEQCQSRVLDVRALANDQARLLSLSGRDRNDLTPQGHFQQYKTELLAQIGEAAIGNARSGRVGTVGNRPPTHLTYPQDPSLLDPIAWAEIDQETNDARKTPDVQVFGFDVGKRWSRTLAPTYHTRGTVLDMLFPDGPAGSLESLRHGVALEVTSLCRNPATIAAIERQLCEIIAGRSAPVRTVDRSISSPEMAQV